MKIKLHSKYELYLIVNVYTIEKRRVEPVEMRYNKIEKSELVTDKIKTFVATRIENNDDIVVYEQDFFTFIELLNCFTSNLLEIDKDYDLLYQNGNGYEARIVQKDRVKFLELNVKRDYLYLSKYDCKVIISNFKKIYSKCLRQEFL
jgi:hypothetical protein